MKNYILIGGFGILILGYMYIIQTGTQELNRLGRENNTYHRTTACILSVPLANRTDSYISNCYTQAERENNIRVDHFGGK